MELGLSLGTRGAQNYSGGFCMGLASSARSTAEKKPWQYDGDDDQERRGKLGCSTPLDPSPASSLQLDLLPFSPVRHRTQPPPLLRFTCLADNLSSEPGSSDGPGTRPVGANRRPAAEEGEEQSSPDSETSSFMEFSLYTSSNNNNNNREGGSYAEKDGKNGNNGKNYGQVGIGIVGQQQGERGATTSSKGSSECDEEENNNDGSSTRKKLRLSKQQSAFLEESFKEHHTLNPKQKLALAKQLNLRPRQVEVWFQNRRARTKLKQTEVDCEYLKRCCETLTQENTRLQKELQELRALKTSQPFFMNLPPTTLTMCPSCERVAPTSAPSTSPPSPAVAKPMTILPLSNAQGLAHHHEGAS